MSELAISEGVADSLYTFIMAYRGGTYISQVISVSKEEACIRWVEELRIEEIKGFSSKTKAKLLKQLEEEKLIPIDTCRNTWILCLIVKKKYADVHVVKTVAD